MPLYYVSQQACDFIWSVFTHPSQGCAFHLLLISPMKCLHQCYSNRCPIPSPPSMLQAHHHVTSNSFGQRLLTLPKAQVKCPGEYEEVTHQYSINAYLPSLSLFFKTSEQTLAKIAHYCNIHLKTKEYCCQACLESLEFGHLIPLTMVFNISVTYLY